MHKCGAACVFVRTDRGYQRRNAGADILTHYDRNSRTVGHRTGGGKRLKNSDGGRAGLNYSGQQRTDEHTENGIREHEEQLLKAGNIPKSRHCAGHGLHAVHKGGKAEHDESCVALFILLAEHIQHYSDEREHGCKRCRLEQTHPYIIAADARKAEYPRGHGGADIRTHYDVYRLTERHKSGVYKADDHNGGRRRALYDRSHTETGQQTAELAAGQLAEYGFQSVAGAALKSLPHQVHTEKKQT